MGAGGLIDFVNKGGNVLLVADEKISEQQRDFAYEFSVDIDRTRVSDYFHSGPSGSVFSTRLVSPKNVVSSIQGPILYDGIAHILTGKNPLGFKILTASESAFSIADDKSPIGSDLSLLSAFQALNNARVMFCGSIKMFSNEFFNAKIDYNGQKFNFS